MRKNHKKIRTTKTPSRLAKKSRIGWMNKKTVILGILLVLIITGSFFGWKFFHGPATGTVQVTNGQAKNKTAIIAASALSLKTKYFSLDYPGRYQLGQNTSNASGTTASWVFNAHGQLDAGISRIGITLGSLPTGGVANVSAYQRYMSNKHTYKLSQKKFGAATVTIATKYNSADYEQTAFVTNGNRLLIIDANSVTGSTNQLAPEFSDMLNSFKWR